MRPVVGSSQLFIFLVHGQIGVCGPSKGQLLLLSGCKASSLDLVLAQCRVLLEQFRPRHDKPCVRTQSLARPGVSFEDKIKSNNLELIERNFVKFDVRLSRCKTPRLLGVLRYRLNHVFDFSRGVPSRPPSHDPAWGGLLRAPGYTNTNAITHLV